MSWNLVPPVISVLQLLGVTCSAGVCQLMSLGQTRMLIIHAFEGKRTTLHSYFAVKEVTEVHHRIRPHSVQEWQFMKANRTKYCSDWEVLRPRTGTLSVAKWEWNQLYCCPREGLAALPKPQHSHSRQVPVRTPASVRILWAETREKGMLVWEGTAVTSSHNHALLFPQWRKGSTERTISKVTYPAKGTVRYRKVGDCPGD